MIKFSLDQTARKLHMEFPHGQRTRRESFTYRDAAHAEWLWSSNVSKYIIATLTSWVKHREWTLKYLNEMTPAKGYAIIALRTMLDSYSESKMETVVRHVIKHDDDIALLVPGMKSRYHNHYMRQIAPLRDWCKSLTQVSVPR